MADSQDLAIEPSDSLALETQLIIESLRTCSLPKLTYADATHFEALLRDVFPNSINQINSKKNDFSKKLTVAIHEVLAENRLEVVDGQVCMIYFVTSPTLIHQSN